VVAVNLRLPRILSKISTKGVSYMENNIMSYEEFKESKKSIRYINGIYKCIVCGKVPAFWEVGDSRYYCPACEEHSRIKDDYDMYRKSMELKVLHCMR
jgi:Zn finger protein HypA/HybF involved in hydrogenase expression